MTGTAYCEASDLLTGNIPAPSGMDLDKVVQDAADEIDSQIGFVYETPVDLTQTTPAPLPRPVKLLMKRINVFLATGRLILAVDANGEDEQLHAYGLSLVREAQASLAAIAKGTITLEGVPVLAGGVPEVTGPMLYNKDIESNVEAFYDRICNPSYNFSGFIETERTPYRFNADRGFVS